ncbi:MAG: 50S ribosomal protein L32e [Methanosarcinales archaeon Met12]|nr:MAG: 50S ribosomal protein L32e [Methanosarcinales archaeon Met12]
MTEIIRGLPKIKGLGKAKTNALVQAGFSSVGDIQKASLEDITAVDGISPTLAEDVKKAVQRLETRKPAKKKKKLAAAEKPVKMGFSGNRERLLRVRRQQKSKKPSFRRHDSHKKKRVGASWRFPSGIHNKQRSGIVAKGAMVQIGYGSPKEVRGFHPSGYEEVLVHNLNEVDMVDTSIQVIRIGSTVGLKKRLDIEEKAEELGLKILNPVKRE